MLGACLCFRQLGVWYRKACDDDGGQRCQCGSLPLKGTQRALSCTCGGLQAFAGKRLACLWQKNHSLSVTGSERATSRYLAKRLSI